MGSSIDRLSFVKERVAILAEDIGSESFLNVRDESSAYDYGFTDVPALKSKSFRIGIYLTDIKVVATAENKESAIGLLNNIVTLLKSVKVSGRSILFYEDMKKEVEGGESLRQFAGRIDNAIFTEIGEPAYVRLGQWCEGGRIAAVKRTKRFYNIDDIRVFIERLEKERLPEGVLKSLNEIENVVKAGVYTEGHFKALENEYENLISLF